MLTYFAPNTVVVLISTRAFDGIFDIWPGSIANFRFAWSPTSEIDSTRPTCTPRNFTLALGSMTRPARVDVTVMGVLLVNPPENMVRATATIATSPRTRPTAANFLCHLGTVIACPPIPTG